MRKRVWEQGRELSVSRDQLINATNAPPRTRRCRTRNTNRVSSLKRHRARLGMSAPKLLLKYVEN